MGCRCLKKYLSVTSLCLFLQLIMVERERTLSRGSFCSDLALFGELDQFQGTTGSASYSRSTILSFLRSKGWVIEDLENVEDPHPEEVNNCMLLQWLFLFKFRQILAGKIQ